MEQWISLRGYARHRSVALSAVQKAIETKRVTAVRRDHAGRCIGVELHQADAQWVANTDPVEAMRNGKFYGSAPGLSQAEIHTGGRRGDVEGADQDPRIGPTEDLAPGIAESSTTVPLTAAAAPAPVVPGDQARYLSARAEREEIAVQQGRLDYLEQIGTLVSAGAVEKEIAEIFGTIKSNVLRIADRKAQILAAESDPARVHRLLSEEFRMVFDELSRRFADDVAGGGEEPATALS